MTKSEQAIELLEDSLRQVEKMLKEERTCHDDCMCNICIAKQQTWEAQQALALLEQPKPTGEIAEFLKKCRGKYTQICIEDSACGEDFNKALVIIDQLKSERDHFERIHKNALKLIEQLQAEVEANR